MLEKADFAYLDHVADRQHQAVGRLQTGELTDVGVHLLGFAAEIDGLPNDMALDARVGVGEAEPVQVGARKSGHAVRVRETEALIDLGLDPSFD